MKTRLWFIRETEKACLYSKLPPERNPNPEDHIWIPRSVIEHRLKLGNEHHLTITDWFADEEDL